MSRNYKTCSLFSSVTAAALGFVSSVNAQETRPLYAPAIAAAPGGVNVFLTADDDKGEEAARSQYWLGLSLAPLPSFVKAQLDIEEGVVVQSVKPESPAAKADIKKHDILIKAGQISLKDPDDMTKALEEAKDKELTIVALRGGKQLTIKVVAAKRPTNEPSAEVWKNLRAQAPELDEEIKKLQEAFEKLKNKAGGDALGLMFARPGMVAPSVSQYWQMQKSSELPKNISIQINKEGDKPAKIHVKKDDKEWDVTEDKLDELPNDVKEHVKQYLSRPMGFNMQFRAPAASSATTRAIRVQPDVKVQPEVKVGPVPERSLNAKIDPFGLENKLNEIVKKLDQLRKDVDEIRAKK